MASRFAPARKSFIALLAALAVGILMAPQAHARVNKAVVGEFKGSGTFVDKRQAGFTYTYTFTDIDVNVKSSGKLSGSASASGALNGIPLIPPTTVTVSGKAKTVTVTKSTVTASGQLKFSDGTSIDGVITVNATSGKGTFKVKYSDSQFDANFTLKKSARKK